MRRILPLLLFSVSAFAENPNAPADFTVNTTVVTPHPDRYGVNNAISGFADFNNKVTDPGFEPFVIRKKGTANGGGADFLLNSTTPGPTTTVFDILGDGFFDGADIRVYRTVNGQMTLLRAGTVQHYYGGFNRIINNRLTGTTFHDGGLVAGRTYYYTVRAFDTSGNQSANSNVQSIVALANGGVADTVTGAVTQTITDQSAPAAPTGLAATANANGTVTLTWNANSEADLNGYWVFRAESDPGLHNHIEITGSGPAMANGDIYIMEMNPDNVPMEKLSPRVRTFFSGNDSWRETGAGVSKTRDSSTRAPENGGRTSLKLSASSANEVSVRQFRLAAPDGFYGSLEPNTTYRAEVYLKQQGVPSGDVTFRLTGPYAAFSNTWHNVTGEWQKFTYEFTTTPNYPLQNQGTAEIVIAFTGPGDVWMDNLYLYDPTQETFAPRPAAQQQLADYMPGWFRTDAGHTDANWGSSMEDWTNDDSLAQNQFNTFGGRSRPEQPYHLPYALQRAKDSGANPWLIVGSYMNEQEWANLIEYLAGPAGTPYGDKRIAQRGGISTPWMEEFTRIRFEYGNELWNPTFEWGLSGALNGQFGEYFFNKARQSPYFAAFANKVDFVLDGQLVSAATNGYAATAMQVTPAVGAPGRLATSANLALYLGGWDANIIIGGGEVNAAGFADYLMYSGTYGKHWFDQQAQTRDIIAAQGRPYQLANYEAGPGYGLPSGNAQFDPVSEAYGKSLAAGVATLDCFLYGTYKRIDPQCYFTFQQGTNWASHAYLNHGNHPYASWLALRMRNRYVTGDMIATSVNTVPTHDQPAWINSTNGGIAAPAAPSTPLTACYAFRDGGKYSVFVLSRKYSGDTPVTLRLPFNSMTSGTLYKLTGAPDARNDQGTFSVQEQQQAVTDFAQNYSFTLPASSAYLFVFNGATTVAETNPACTITQALSQVDPTSTQSVSFNVHFSQPITGFTASDVVIGGSAGATAATVTEIAPNLGTDFQVDVVGMTNSGTVTINVPAAAAFNASGQGNLAASIIDNSVQFNMAPFVAYDDFNLTPPNQPFLNGIATGAGFAAAWQLTNFNATTYGDGYKLATTTPLSYLNLRRTGSYAAGGKNFDVAARLLDVDNTFAFYKIAGSAPSVIGRSGTTLWMSAMFRKETADTNRLLLFTMPSTGNISIGGSNLAFGFCGDIPATSVVNGTRYWSMQVRNATNNGFDCVRSNVPVVNGQTALLVLKCSFGSTDRFDLFVNPSSLGGAAPASPDATWTTTGATDINFLMLGYSGGTTGSNQSSIDELRFGQSFADVTPTFTASESWRITFFGSPLATDAAADNADPDHDGLCNLLEYALGNHPNNAASHSLPTSSTTTSGQESYLTLTVPRNVTATDLSYVVEVSPDLISWFSGPTYTALVSEDSSSLVVRDNTPMSAATKRFIRLRVTR